MTRKTRKQNRKARHQQKSTMKWTDKLAKKMSKYIASLPTREHQGDSFMSIRGSGCVPFGKLFGYAYCKSCYAESFCQIRLNPKWWLENDNLLPLRGDRDGN